MIDKDIMDALVGNLSNLDEREMLALVQQCLENGDDPLDIIEACQRGLRLVGEGYEKGQYYISWLVVAGDIFRRVMELLQPAVEKRVTEKKSGRLMLGTVESDIHDIGKNIQAMLLTCYGFSVYDLGVDVPPSEFLAQAAAIKPHIIGLSGLLTTTYDSMRETVRMLRSAKDPEIADIPVIIGGAKLNEQVCEYVGADYWVTDGMSGVRLCQQLLPDD